MFLLYSALLMLNLFNTPEESQTLFTTFPFVPLKFFRFYKNDKQAVLKSAYVYESKQTCNS